MSAVLDIGLNGEGRALVHTAAYQQQACSAAEIVSTGEGIGDYSACQFGSLGIAFNGKNVVLRLLIPGTNRPDAP